VSDPAGGLARAVELVRDRGVVAQICVRHEGRVVLDSSIRCTPDRLFWTFSASKPFVAMLVHLLAQRGELSLDDRVSSVWPDFGRNGKQDITIRQVLQHRSGVAVARGAVPDALAMTRWRRSVRLLERARPQWTPGEVPAYHYISYGFILGEIVQRVTGRRVSEFLTTEVLEPAGLRDTYLGLPRRELYRRVPLRVVGPAARMRAAFLNRRRVRRAVIPAGGISTTARDLSGFYQLLLGGGPAVFAPATIEQARVPSADGEVDRFLHTPVRWSQGFQLGGPSTDPQYRRAFGGLSSTETFGHNGSGCCIGWADPTRRLAFGYVTDLLPVRREGARHMADVADAILAAYS
jgi:CubicO group peptidase (beta-lactamase class C family)